MLPSRSCLFGLRLVVIRNADLLVVEVGWNSVRYQHCKEKHLHRYVAEFDFRYSNRTALGIDDATCAALLATGIKGKRLTYRRPHSKGSTTPN